MVDKIKRLVLVFVLILMFNLSLSFVSSVTFNQGELNSISFCGDCGGNPTYVYGKGKCLDVSGSATSFEVTADCSGISGLENCNSWAPGTCVYGPITVPTCCDDECGYALTNNVSCGDYTAYPPTGCACVISCSIFDGNLCTKNGGYGYCSGGDCFFDCYDGDGGREEIQPSYVTLGGTKYDDQCYNYLGIFPAVHERYCSGGSVATEDIRCTGGDYNDCVDGACKFCSDTDGGNNPYSAGTISTYEGSHNDSCPSFIFGPPPDPDILTEYYCEGVSLMVTEIDCKTISSIHDYTCIQGKSKCGCESNADCASGYYCDLTSNLCEFGSPPCTPTCSSKSDCCGTKECGTVTNGCGTNYNCGDCVSLYGVGWTCSGGTCIPPACTPDCSCASTTCIGQTCVDPVCGTSCDGTKAPDCSCASTTCIGQTCVDPVCGTSCDGTKAPDCGSKVCGPAPNGCGGANECGTCSGVGASCDDGTCVLPTADWINSSGGVITTIDYLYGFEPTSVYLISRNLGAFNIGDEIDFEIKEEDSIFDDTIGTISGNVEEDANGKYAKVLWNISDENLTAGGYDSENPLDFYFIVKNVFGNEFSTSNTLNTNISEFTCTETNVICSDYDSSITCESDPCNVAADSVETTQFDLNCGESYVGDKGCTVTSDCRCKWNSDNGICESARIDTEDCGEVVDIGWCLYTEDTSDNCEDGFLDYNWTGLYNWLEANIFDGNGSPPWGNYPSDYIEDPIGSGEWHYDPENISGTCVTGGTNRITCPTEIAVPFFNLINLLVAVLIILIIYYLIRNKKDKKLKKKLASKNKKTKLKFLKRKLGRKNNLHRK